MRLFWLIYAAFCLWLEAPIYAHADPISAFIIGALGITAGSAAATAVTVGVNLVVGFAISSIAGLASSALGKKKPKGSLASAIEDRQRLITDNFTGTVDHVPVIYGTAKIGGLRCYMETSVDNKLAMVLVLSEGEIDSVQTVFLNNINKDDAKYVGKHAAYPLTGAVGQTLPEIFRQSAPGLTANHTFTGFACIAITFEPDGDLFPSIPTVTVVVRGRKILDTRTNVTAYGENPAMVLRDYLTNNMFGAGIDASKIDLTTFEAAANHCDELVNNSTSGTQKRYTANGIVITSDPVFKNIENILTSFNAVMFYSQGKYVVVPMKAESVSYYITNTHIISQVSDQKAGKRARRNEIRAQYINPANNWQADVAIYQNAAFLTQDGETLYDDLDLPFTSNRDTAKQLAQIAVNQSRLERKVNFNMSPAAVQFSIGDVVSISRSTRGWVNLLFRVMSLTLNADGTVAIGADEYDADVFALEALTQERLSSGGSFNSPSNVQAPGSPSFSETLTESRVGVKSLLRITWSASPPPYVLTYELQYKLGSSPDWITHSTGSSREREIQDLEPALYNFRVKGINALGFGSPYATANYEVLGLTVPPAALLALNINIIGLNAHLSWPPVVDLDVKNGGQIEIRHTEETLAPLWASSIPIHKVTGISTEAAVPLLDGTYLVKTLDSSGSYSTSFASALSTGVTLNGRTLLNNLDLSPNYPGTLTQTYRDVSSSTLALDGVGLFDSQAGLADAASGNFDSGSGGQFYTTGSYDSGSDTNGVMDLGTVQDITLVLKMRAFAYDGGSFFDEARAAFDYRAGLFDGSDVSGVDVFAYVSTTQDDPAGTPIWTPWQRLLVNDVVARAYKVKLKFSSLDSGLNAQVTQLEVAAWSQI